jgi:hypothetical protein
MWNGTEYTAYDPQFVLDLNFTDGLKVSKFKDMIPPKEKDDTK